jgi:predicted nucleic acid-binding protein
MPDKVFVDSTTFLYSIQRQDLAKREQSRVWLEALIDRGVTNLQALNEIANVLTKKSARFPGVDPFSQVDAFAAFGSTPVTWSIVSDARALHSRYRYSWWDCVLLASAIELDCTHFLSEDLHDGQIITGMSGKGLTIVDPFAHSPANIFSE